MWNGGIFYKKYDALTLTRRIELRTMCGHVNHDNMKTAPYMKTLQNSSAIWELNK
jgi:hypothetical protein